MALYFGDLLPYSSLLLEGLWTALYITIVAMLAGSALGVLVYLGKAGPGKTVSILCTCYIEAIRNTPLLVQLYLIYFALPALGINLEPVWAAVIGLTLNNAAYTAEIYRAGFESVPRGLREAGKALGMKPAQIVPLHRAAAGHSKRFPRTDQPAHSAVLGLVDWIHHLAP